MEQHVDHQDHHQDYDTTACATPLATHSYDTLPPNKCLDGSDIYFSPAPACTTDFEPLSDSEEPDLRNPSFDAAKAPQIITHAPVAAMNPSAEAQGGLLFAMGNPADTSNSSSNNNSANPFAVQPHHLPGQIQPPPQKFNVGGLSIDPQTAALILSNPRLLAAFEQQHQQLQHQQLQQQQLQQQQLQQQELQRQYQQFQVHQQQQQPAQLGHSIASSANNTVTGDILGADFSMADPLFAHSDAASLPLPPELMSSGIDQPLFQSTTPAARQHQPQQLAQPLAPLPSVPNTAISATLPPFDPLGNMHATQPGSSHFGNDCSATANPGAFMPYLDGHAMQHQHHQQQQLAALTATSFGSNLLQRKTPSPFSDGALSSGAMERRERLRGGNSSSSSLSSSSSSSPPFSATAARQGTKKASRTTSGSSSDTKKQTRPRRFCPICKHVDKKTKSGICTVCYCGIYNDLSKWWRQIGEATYSTPPSVEQVHHDLQFLVKRGCTSGYKCGPERYHNALPSKEKCTRCRTLAICRQKPNAIAKILIAFYKHSPQKPAQGTFLY